MSAQFRIFHGPAAGATGLHIAAMVAVSLAISRFAGDPLLRELTVAAIVGASLLTIPAVRRMCRELLAPSSALRGKWELSCVVVFLLAITFAVLAAFALSAWISGSDPALGRRMDEPFASLAQGLPEIALPASISALAAMILAAAFEDIVFLGMLYPAWTLQWGWMRAALATSAAWALGHPDAAPQLFTAIVLVCLLRRTGSLPACIAVHAVRNILLSYALLGRYLLPLHHGTGEIGAWDAHLACLGLVLPALLAYLWMARDDEASLPMDPAEAIRRR